MIENLYKLAQSWKYQTILAMLDKNCIEKLFNNSSNFSKIQLLFFHELLKCRNLYEEMVISKNKYLTEEVIKDYIRVEAYDVWKRKQEENQKSNEIFLNDYKNAKSGKQLDSQNSFEFVMKTPTKEK